MLSSRHASSLSLSLTDDERRGCTFDSVKNLNVGQHERMRYDRVLSAADRISTRRQLKPLSIKLVGTTPLDYDLLPELPSDGELDDNHDDPRIENYSCLNHSRYARWLRGSQKKEFKGKMCMYPSDHFGLLCEFLV